MMKVETPSAQSNEPYSIERFAFGLVDNQVQTMQTLHNQRNFHFS